MKERLRVLKMDKYEHGIIFDSLNARRNALIQQNEPTDFVDEVLLKVADAPYRTERGDAAYER